MFYRDESLLSNHPPFTLAGVRFRDLVNYYQDKNGVCATVLFPHGAQPPEREPELSLPSTKVRKYGVLVLLHCMRHLEIKAILHFTRLT